MRGSEHWSGEGMGSMRFRAFGGRFRNRDVTWSVRKIFPAIILLLVAFTAASATAAIPGEPLDVAVRDAINPGLGRPPADADRSSPAGAWLFFLKTSGAGRFGAAAHLLDLTEVAEDQQVAVGTQLAERLYQVLRAVGARAEQVDHVDPVGPRRDGVALNALVVATFEKSGVSGEVWLRRTQDAATGELAWLFTRQTVSSISFWYRVLVRGEAPAVEGRVNPGLGRVPEDVSRGNPRAALVGFLREVRKGRFSRAAHYLDLESFPEGVQAAEGSRLARRLMLVMTRRVPLDPGTVSNDEFGAPQQGVPPDFQRIASLEVDGQSRDIMLARRVDPEHGSVWTFSRDTTDGIDTLYRSHGFGWFGEVLPAPLFTSGVGGLLLWQWAGLLLLLPLGWLVGRWIAFLVVRMLRIIAARSQSGWDDELVKVLDGPLAVILWGLILAATTPWLGLPAGGQAAAAQLWKAFSLFGFGWLLFRLADGTAAYLRQAAADTGSVGVSFVPILTRVVKALVFTFVVLAILDVVGVNVVAILTGLGIGGLAIAFAAQRTLENLFGAAAIAGDRPFIVGQFVTVGDVTGTVEDVGLRSTRIRRLDRTIVTVPNSTVANAQVVNFAVRDRFLYNPTIGVVYATTADQLRFIIDEIRKMLIRDERVLPDVRRVRFGRFGASSLDIDTFCWVQAADWGEFTGIAEDLNFKIMEIVHRAGSSFAFPSQSVYLSRDAGLDAARVDEVAKEVRRRRKVGELAIPEASEELIARLEAEREANS